MDQQPEIWKAEAAQLKEDLRKKKIVRREVPIQFGGVKEASGNSHSATPSPSLPQSGNHDELLRKQLGL